MHLRAVTAVLATALALAACTGAPSDVDQADGGPAADGAVTDRSDDSQTLEDAATDPVDEEPTGAPDATSTTEEALWWTAETVDDGTEFAAADLAGEKVVLWMWAPWCSVCNREAPEVADALPDLPEDVTVIGVAGRDDVGPMRAFVAEHGLGGITHVVDDDGSVWASYGISYQPAWVFIDSDGRASVAAGALGYDGLFAGIEEVFAS